MVPHWCCEPSVCERPVAHSSEVVAIWMAQEMATGDGGFWLGVGRIQNVDDHALK